MKTCGIDTDNMEKLAANRSAWKSTVFKGCPMVNGKWLNKQQLKNFRGKTSQHTSVEQQNNAPVFTCLNCGQLQIKDRSLQP